MASFWKVIVVQRLPKSRSKKILRKLVRNITDGVDLKIPSSIDNVIIIDHVKEIYKENNI